MIRFIHCKGVHVMIKSVLMSDGYCSKACCDSSRSVAFAFCFCLVNICFYVYIFYLKL